MKNHNIEAFKRLTEIEQENVMAYARANPGIFSSTDSVAQNNIANPANMAHASAGM